MLTAGVGDAMPGIHRASKHVAVPLRWHSGSGVSGPPGRAWRRELLSAVAGVLYSPQPQNSRNAKDKWDTYIRDSSGAFGNQPLYFVSLSDQQLHKSLLGSTLLSVNVLLKAKPPEWAELIPSQVCSTGAAGVLGSAGMGQLSDKALCRAEHNSWCASSFVRIIF